ncbi:hypothetical protein CCU68_03855 [Pseudomonas gingeri NCPPB 3146 = LMG 5327]|uniref:Uncharacterized protein n=2 Tax=Pseudomonas gingeri TaxID=117681 RepID=A0A7Y7Y3B8_9PSED|nr:MULTISPECIES: hypothetical protein [Pseudomonas]NVZ25803.1 hypothetical protein [Pseudomonas gingeri]NVZ60775.1 hypothetical protein [Pseudomonas gingeri]NVZ73846.1 hypothetical protein [Pseudomonas gingeri]NWA06379.1 hypothetical protein [Pseudomonas gingeri]NWC17056.1 hypothetical protein [Pseudomonas gingeri]
MEFLWYLFFPRKPHRSFALLGADGRCQAFKQCELPPMGDGWVEIEEIRLVWLHQPLPASARVSPRVRHSRRPQPLTI